MSSNSIQPFTKMIHDNPDDPAPVLVLTDWLEERGRCRDAALLRESVEVGLTWRDKSPLANARRRMHIMRLEHLSHRPGFIRIWRLASAVMHRMAAKVTRWPLLEVS